MNLQMFAPYLGKLTNKKGQGMVEYALLIGLISVVVVGILVLFGPQLSLIFNQVLAALRIGANPPAAQ